VKSLVKLQRGLTLKERIDQLLTRYPQLSAKRTAEILGVDHARTKKYVWNRRCVLRNKGLIGTSRRIYRTIGGDLLISCFEFRPMRRAQALAELRRSIRDQLRRSQSTVHARIHGRNQAIDRAGFCTRCQRAVSQRMEEAARARSV